ncbi:nuclear transport factor 2 family protein [Pseudonocardia parietis]|uniref:Ketosteroid isomerase-like protein n=1 Tax=Pseudonocardia parietis TaxID=570936 RepID=A0ABS4VYJ1_9PSEU|nr:nuclear transport factor 2 family protein [Pseudonocardia parietis]MBP2368995.1 ketosteroid isomerase-like protein [Pseudonocardia parietis]
MSTPEDRNKQTVTEFMEVFSGGDVDAILDRMTDDATWWVAGNIPGISGTKDKTGFKDMVSGIAESTTSGAIRLTPLAFTAEGERVAVETESYTELKNGRIYNNIYHFLFTVRDGKIAGVKEYLDTEHTTAVFVAP